jgi:hypothetical protein
MPPGVDASSGAVLRIQAAARRAIACRTFASKLFEQYEEEEREREAHQKQQVSQLLENTSSERALLQGKEQEMIRKQLVRRRSLQDVKFRPELSTLELAKLLVQKGGLATAHNSVGQTPLSLASAKLVK